MVGILTEGCHEGAVRVTGFGATMVPEVSMESLMCIILFGWQSHLDYPLVVAANRDEFHHRPAEAARWRGHVWCGLDKAAGGTWLGVTEGGRFAALTNFREPLAEQTPGRISRGHLPLAYLEGEESPQAYMRRVEREERDFAGFNLLVGDRNELWYFSNRSEDSAIPATPGIHGLSNGLLDDPWPKTLRGKRLLRQAMDQGLSREALLALLQDRWQPEDENLPDTGVDLHTERLVAPIFIHSQGYGTRASSAVLVPGEGEPAVAEQRWGPDGEPLEAVAARTGSR